MPGIWAGFHAAVQRDVVVHEMNVFTPRDCLGLRPAVIMSLSVNSVPSSDRKLVALIIPASLLYRKIGWQLRSFLMCGTSYSKLAPGMLGTCKFI